MEKMKIIAMAIYAAAGIAGLMTVYGLLTSAGMGLSLANWSQWGLGLGGLAWGLLKFANIDIVKMISIV